MSKPDTVHNLKSIITDWGRGPHKRIVFEDLSMNLPLEASLAGMTLEFETPLQSVDPVYLKDGDGNILKEWWYIPSLTEVRETSLKYLGQCI